MSEWSNYPLSLNEAKAYVERGELPKNFAERVALFLEFGDCANCDGVRCMHFVMRDWWGPGMDECNGWCCPDCSDLKPD